MATPSLAMIPSGYKASKVYSVLPESGVGDFDFTRATTATRINSSGLIEEMAINVPRLEYPLIDGVVNGCPSLLLEPQRTNIVNYSEDFSNSYWTKSNTLITSNSVISPDGTLNADKLTEDNASSTKLMFKSGISTLGTISVFAKKGDDNNRLFQIRRDGGDNSWSWFNLEDGIISSQVNGIASIENYSNGWYRCSFTPTNSNGTVVFGISNGGTSRSVSYQGNGTSGVYIFGAMLEQGSYPTSYIPTNGSSVTRSAETANGSGDAATFNDSEGVLMVEMSALDNDGTNRDISITDGTSTNLVTIRYTSIDNEITYKVKSGGSAIVSDTVTISSATSFSKIAAKYKLNDFTLWIDGFEVFTDTSGTAPIGLSELVFNGGSGSNDFYGKTKQIQYYNSVLTDSELEQLTSWTSFSDMANGQQYSII